MDGALCDDAAVVDDRRHVAGLLDLVEQVRGEQHGAALGDELADEAAELEDAGGIEPVERLIEDQQLGIGQQAARHAEALAHAQRVALDAVVATRAQPDALQRAVDAAVGRAVAGGRVDVEVLAAGEVGMEARLLDDRADARERRGALAGEVVTEDPHVAGGRLGEPEEQADQGRLAGAVGSEEAEGGAPRDFEVDSGERRAIAEALAQIGGVDRQGTAAIGGGRGHAATLCMRPPAHIGLWAQPRAAVRMRSAGGLIPSDEPAAAGGGGLRPPFAARWRRPGPRARGSGRSRAARRSRRCAGAPRACRRARGGR